MSNSASILITGLVIAKVGIENLSKVHVGVYELTKEKIPLDVALSKNSINGLQTSLEDLENKIIEKRNEEGLNFDMKISNETYGVEKTDFGKFRIDIEFNFFEAEY